MRIIQNLFFLNLYSNIILCENTSIISVGDWNMVQNYEKDTLNYVNQNNPKSQETLFHIMNELDIHDNWRIQNPDVHRFSRRGPGGKQSRLDYVLVSSDVETFIIKFEIGIAYRSDHSPVSICLQFNNKKGGKVFGNLTIVYFQIMNISMKSKRSYKK
jgi:exonuclease III